MHYGSAYSDEYYSHSIRTIFPTSFKQMFLQIALVCFSSRAMPAFFWHWKTYSNDYAVKLYLCPGLVKASDLWMCQMFWILWSFISCAKGAPSNKLHIKNIYCSYFILHDFYPLRQFMLFGNARSH